MKREASTMERFVSVTEGDPDEAVELPAEADGTLLMSTLSAQFPGASGLKYKSPDSKAMRGLRVDENKIDPPSDGWGDRMYLVVFSKENAKRKMDADVVGVGSGGGDWGADGVWLGGGGGAAKLKRVDHRKCTDLIVLGLPYRTTQDQLRQYFQSAYGHVVVAEIKRDAQTGKSKGFGFIRFVDYEAQLKALAQRHMIDGRWCDVRIPDSKADPNANEPPLRKIFVGRVPESMSTEDLRDYFTRFGEVTDVYIPRPYRAFAFVTFLDPDVAQDLCGDDHVINGVSVHVSSATPKPGPGSASSHIPPPPPPGGPPPSPLYRSFVPAGGGGAAPSPSGYTNAGRGDNGQGHAAYAGYNDYNNGPGGYPYGGGGPPATTSMGVQPPPGTTGGSIAAGTSQATVGMNNLNLGVSPNILAAAHAALLSALSSQPSPGAGGGPPPPDFNTILNSLHGHGGAPPPPTSTQQHPGGKVGATPPYYVPAPASGGGPPPPPPQSGAPGYW